MPQKGFESSAGILYKVLMELGNEILVFYECIKKLIVYIEKCPRKFKKPRQDDIIHTL